jgi:excisionase family DNA binding protein
MLRRMDSQTVSLQKLSYSFAEAEVISNLSRSTLYREVARGRLRRVKVGKRSLIPADALASLCGVTDSGESHGSI